MLRDQSSSGSGDLIGCLTYQSRAASVPSKADLESLVAKARIRNRGVGVTGMLLYEGGRFLQTLEGPPKGLEAVWTSIQRDERHADIELLARHSVSARLFSDWDLLLYRKLEQAPRTLREKLRRSHPLASHKQKIVELAFAGQQAEIGGLLTGIAGKGWGSDDIIAYLLEPAARAMGDSWLTDDCGDFDLTYGLGALQTACHILRHAASPNSKVACIGDVIFASAPGEPHLFSPAVLADQFVDAGWGVDVVFPRSAEAMASLLGERQPDAVDIALSDALPRQDKIKELREVVRLSRLAMPNKPLVISVGGRLFAEGSATAEHVGADHARKSIAGARASIAGLVNSARSSRLLL